MRKKRRKPLVPKVPVQTLYKVRHKPSGKYVGKGWANVAPWTLVTTGGRTFKTPFHAERMFVSRKVTAEKLLRHGLGHISEYEVVPFILIEVPDEAIPFREVILSYHKGKPLEEIMKED